MLHTLGSTPLVREENPVTYEKPEVLTVLDLAGELQEKYFSIRKIPA